MKNDNFHQNYDRINKECNIENIKIPSEWSYAYDVYEDNNKIDVFCNDNSKIIEDEIKNIDFDFLKDHPVLGNCSENHSYFKKPLYRYTSLKEPQFTKALAYFLLENQLCCKAFIESVFELLEKDIPKLPDEGYDCYYEVVTRHVKGKTRKRIDNIIVWGEQLLCIEIKFDAKIDGNDLNAYKKQAEKIQKDRQCNCDNINCIVISIDNVKADIMEKNCSEWNNILWIDLLQLWERKIAVSNKKDIETEDMARYRTSLWYKILGEEEN